jgi:PPOX class probable F420-dependent enzyme
MNIDRSTEFGRRVERRLREEKIIWLTTLDQESTPQPRPVWFLWDGEDELLMYSRPNTHKLRHIERHPRVSLNFDGDGQGEDIVVFTGEATIQENETPADEVTGYVEKYRELLPRINLTAEEFAHLYSVPVRVRLTGLRGH